MDNFFSLGHHRLHVGYVYLLAAFLAASSASAQWSSSDSSNLSDIQINIQATSDYLQNFYFTWLDDLLPAVQSIEASGSVTSNQLDQIQQYSESISSLASDATTYAESIDDAIANIELYIQSQVIPTLSSAEQYIQGLVDDTMYIRSDTSQMVSQGSDILSDLHTIESGIDDIVSAINNLELTCDCGGGDMDLVISNWYGYWSGWWGEDGELELIIDAIMETTLEIIETLEDNLQELSSLGTYLTQISGQIDDFQNAILDEMRLEFHWWTNTVYSVMSDLIPSGFDAAGAFDTSQTSFINYQDFIDTSQAVTNFVFAGQTWNSNFFDNTSDVLSDEAVDSAWLDRLTDVTSSRLEDLALDGLDAFEANFEQGGDIYIDAFSILGQSSSNIQLPLSLITDNNEIKTFFSNMWRFIVLCSKLGVTIALSFKITRMVAGESGKNPLGV